MLRAVTVLTLLMVLPSCSANMGSSSVAQPGFGYAANDAAPSYSGSRSSSGSSGSEARLKQRPQLKIPPQLAKSNKNKSGKTRTAARARDDKLSPSDYQDIRGKNGKSKAVRKASRAKSDDLAPKGTFDKAPKGAFSKKEYSRTQLDAIKARNLINSYRKSHGLPALSLNSRLTKAAMMHSRDLARFDRISHHGSDGSDPWDRVRRSGYRARVAAENVGTGQSDLKEVMKGWKDSPGHNANLLLKDATHMGIALVFDKKTEYRTFWTLVLGAPL